MIEGDPRSAELSRVFQKELVPLWPQGELKIAQFLPGPKIEELLMALQGRHQLERGLEHIGQVLEKERAGLMALQERLSQAPAYRISRLLLMGDNGSERFYRHCERLLIQHGDRLLGVKLKAMSTQLIESLYGPDAQTKVLLISKREAVTQFLWSLLDAS